MFCLLKKVYIYPAFVSKHNSNREKNVILLMIPNREKIALSCCSKFVSIIKWLLLRALLRPNIMVILILWIAFLLSEEKTKLDLIEEYVKIKDFCNIITPSEDTKILEFNQYQKSDKASIIAGIECLIKRLMDVKVILKIHSQEIKLNTFHHAFVMSTPFLFINNPFLTLAPKIV